MVQDYQDIDIFLMHHNDLFDYCLIHIIQDQYYQVLFLVMLEDKIPVDRLLIHI
jgi:hypothetical protein